MVLLRGNTSTRVSTHPYENPGSEAGGLSFMFHITAEKSKYRLPRTTLFAMRLIEPRRPRAVRSEIDCRGWENPVHYENEKDGAGNDFAILLRVPRDGWD